MCLASPCAPAIDEMNRAYTVGEIDALRRACKLRWLYGTTRPTGGVWSRSYKEDEMQVCVEQMVRTYMEAGVTASDIVKEDEDSWLAGELKVRKILLRQWPKDMWPGAVG